MRNKVITVTMNPSVDKTIVLEQLVPYGLNRVVSSRLDPGGKGINVGRVLHGFGADVTATGLIAGTQGAFLLERLGEEGLDFDFMEIEGETRTNLKIVDNSVGKVTEINEQGFSVLPHQLEAFLERLETCSAQAEIVVLSGSLPPGAPDDFYAQCTEIAKNNGARVLLDADGAALFEGLKAMPYAVKPNLHELELLFHRKFDHLREIADAARELAAGGIGVVIVSMGSDGAIIAGQGELYKTGCWDIEVRSTVGAGDAMTAALSYSLMKQESLLDAARMATAAGTITASKSGTRFCTLEEMLASVEKVKVETL